MNKVKITAESHFVPRLSNNDQTLFYFVYNVKICNEGKKKVQIISRHWDIEDSLGRKRVVDGEGVIGKKPMIEPGKNFEYKSFCPLKTDFGLMKGFYTMKDEEGNLFKASIPQFGLVVPNTVN